MERFLFCFLSIISLALAQYDPRKDAAFTVYKTTALSAAAEVITIQNTTTTSKNVVFQGAYLYCSVPCVIDLERDGTAATTTSLNAAIKNINPSNLNAGTTVTNAYNSSNVGVGSVIQEYQLAGGASLTLDLTSMQLQRATASNMSFRTNSITGSVTIGIKWFEQ